MISHTWCVVLRNDMSGANNSHSLSIFSLSRPFISLVYPFFSSSHSFYLLTEKKGEREEIQSSKSERENQGEREGEKKEKKPRD